MRGYRPPQAVADSAAWALCVRAAAPSSRRGMTAIGLRRAHDLAARRPVSVAVLRRMLSFFARHRVDKGAASWASCGRGWQAWHGWGGDAGERWARAIVRALDGHGAEVD